MSVKITLAVLLLSVAAVAQFNGGRPVLRQSNTFAIANGCSGAGCQGIFLDTVLSGDVILVGINWGAGTQTLGITDNQSSSYTLTTAQSFNDGSGTAFIQKACAIAPTTGSYTLTFSGVTREIDVTIAEFPAAATNGSCSIDATSTVDASAPWKQVTTTPSTSNANEFCFTWAGNWFASSNIYSQFNTAGGDGSFKANVFDYRWGANSGAQSITLNMNPDAAAGWLSESDCYIPALTIISTSLAHGFQSVPYSAQLLSVGGNGNTRTWTKTSGALPAGLSLSAGGAITGTPSGGVGSSAFTAQVSDGTSTKTQSYSISIGASAGTIAVSTHAQLGTGPVTYSGTNGNLTVFVIWGQEQGGSHVWTANVLTGTNNSLTVSPAPSAIFRLYPLSSIPGNNSGANGGPFAIYAFCTPTTGTVSVDSVTTTNTGATPTHAQIGIIEVAHGQIAIDDAFNATAAGSPSSGTSMSLSATGSTVVANEGVVAFGTEGIGQAPVINAPFTQIFSNQSGAVNIVAGFNTYGSAGSVTATMANGSVGSGSSDVMNIEAIPIRPEITGVACGASLPAVATGFSQGFVF